MDTSNDMNLRYSESDLVVIGAGGAGLSAAIAAAEKGISVTVIEKERKAGGTTPFAEGIVAAESPVQKRMGVNITKDELFRSHMDYTHWTLNARLVRALIDKSVETVAWLEEKGLVFNLRSLHGPAVFHVPNNWGSGIIKILLRACLDSGVSILYKTRAEKLLTDKTGKITGLVVKSEGTERTIHAKSIVIASGGYGSSKELMRKYCPYFDVSNIDNLSVRGTHPGDRIRWVGQMHTGDGIQMAFEIGAAR